MLATFRQTLVRWGGRYTKGLYEPVETVFNQEGGETTVSNSEMARWLQSRQIFQALLG